MRFSSGLLTGMAIALVGCLACTIMFPESKEEMCHAAKKISKDMKKDMENMM